MTGTTPAPFDTLLVEQADSVAIVTPDLQGKLMGKRIPAQAL